MKYASTTYQPIPTYMDWVGFYTWWVWLSYKFINITSLSLVENTFQPYLYTPLFIEIFLLSVEAQISSSPCHKAPWQGGPCYTNCNFDSYRPLKPLVWWLPHPIQCSFYFFTLWRVSLKEVPFEFIKLFTGCTWEDTMHGYCCCDQIHENDSACYKSVLVFQPKKPIPNCWKLV